MVNASSSVQSTLFERRSKKKTEKLPSCLRSAWLVKWRVFLVLRGVDGIQTKSSSTDKFPLNAFLCFEPAQGVWDSQRTQPYIPVSSVRENGKVNDERTSIQILGKRKR